MRKHLLPLLLIVLFSCQEKKTADKTTSSDTIIAPETATKTADSVSTDQEATSTDDPISSIRSKVEAINTADLQKKHYEFMCDEKMTVDYFYRNDEIVKISIDFGTVGDVYAKEDYYYDQGKLLFIYEFVEGGPACEGCIKKNEYRTYVAENKTVRYLKDNTATACKKCEFSSSSRHYKLLSARSSAEIKKIMCR